VDVIWAYLGLPAVSLDTAISRVTESDFDLVSVSTQSLAQCCTCVLSEHDQAAFNVS